MFSSVKELLDYIKENDVQMLDFKVVDLTGRLVGASTPAGLSGPYFSSHSPTLLLSSALFSPDYGEIIAPLTAFDRTQLYPLTRGLLTILPTLSSTRAVNPSSALEPPAL